MLLDKVKFFWNADYGHLSFTTDHNVIQNCEAIGLRRRRRLPRRVAADGRLPQRGVLPRAALQHGRPPVRPARLDARLLGLDGQLGADDREPHLRQHGRHLERHAVGRPATPGFPADGMQIDNNYIYSNNLDLYGTEPADHPARADADRHRHRLAGHERRQGLRQLDLRQLAPRHAAGGGPGPARGRRPRATSTRRSTAPARRPRCTSCGNRYEDNVMGRVPPGFTLADGDREVRQPARQPLRRGAAQRRRLLVGRVPGQQRQLLGRQQGRRRHARAASPAPATACRRTRCRPTARTASAPATSSRRACSLDCVTWYDFKGDGAYPLCYWFTMPEQPGSPGCRAATSARGSARPKSFAASADARALRQKLDSYRDAAPGSRSVMARRAGLRGDGGRRRPRVSVPAAVSRPSQRRPSRSASQLGGSVAQLANCGDWDGGAARSQARHDRGHPQPGQPRRHRHRLAAALRRGGAEAVRPGVRAAATPRASGST